MLNGATRRCLLVGVAVLFLGGGGMKGGSGEKLGGEGESCTKAADCKSGLKCVALVCVVDRTAGKAEPAKAEPARAEPAKAEPVKAKGGAFPARDTWKDPTSGLTWQVTPTGGTMNWSAAKSHCAGLSLDSGGWHLPTIGELRSLIRGCPATQAGGCCNIKEGRWVEGSCKDSSCSGCLRKSGPVDGCYWPDEMQGTCGWYWSSSPVVGNDEYDEHAWGVRFVDGFVSGVVDFSVANVVSNVRCVR